MKTFKCLMVGATLTPDGEAYEEQAQARLDAHRAHWQGEELTASQCDALGLPYDRRRPVRPSTTKVVGHTTKVVDV